MDKRYRGKAEISQKASLPTEGEKGSEINSGILVEKVKKFLSSAFQEYVLQSRRKRTAVSCSLVVTEFMRMHVIVPIVRHMDHSGCTNDDESFEALVRSSSTRDLPLL